MGVILVLLGLLSRCSWGTLYIISDLSSFLLFRVFRYRLEVIDRNLKLSFPEKSERELSKIRRQFFRHFTDLVLETVKLTRCTEDELKDRMRLTPDSERELKQLSKGAVVVLGHRGNWELANLFISMMNYAEPVVVYKPLADARFENWFNRLRTRFGSTMTPMKAVYDELEKKRTHPYLVFLVNDQAPNPHTAFWTVFMNQDTGVFRGAEIISRKYNIPVFFGDIRCIEGRRGYYEAEIKQFTNTPDTWGQNTILENQIRFLEKKIKEQPFNWLWSHKRWKHPKPAHLEPEQILEPSDGWEKAKQNS